MTEAEKLEALRDGRWICQVPPCCTYRWDEQSWIKWIDRTGVWKGKDNAENLD